MKTNDRYSRLTLLLAGIVIVFGATSPARAELHRFILEYANISNTRAQARGYIVIDDDPAEFENSLFNQFPFSGAFVKDFQITVSKATDRTHNGSFTASDFLSMNLDLSGGGTADLSKDLVGQNPFNEFTLIPPAGPAPKATGPFTMATGGGSGDQFFLTSFRPMSTTSARVYKCTISLKGSYKYCDSDAFAPGEPQWVCKNYRTKASYYMTIDPVAGRVGFVWLDPKTRTFEVFYQYTLPDLKYAQCRLPSASAPAGRWEACLPLWCHTEDIDIDLAANPSVIDATRCRIACLTGGESPRTFTFNDFNTNDRVRLKDHAVARFKGGFCQTTCYDTLHYSFNDPKRDRVLGWPTALNNPGLFMAGGGSSCITGTISCRLDTRLTAAALRLEAAIGTGNFAAEIEVEDYLLNNKGWSLLVTDNKFGAPLTLQPIGTENLEPLIP